MEMAVPSVYQSQDLMTHVSSHITYYISILFSLRLLLTLSICHLTNWHLFNWQSSLSLIFYLSYQHPSSFKELLQFYPEPFFFIFFFVLYLINLHILSLACSCLLRSRASFFCDQLNQPHPINPRVKCILNGENSIYIAFLKGNISSSLNFFVKNKTTMQVC